MLGKAAAVALALLLAFPATAFAGDWRNDDRDRTPRRHHDSNNSWSSWTFGHDRTDRWDRDDNRDRRGDEGRGDSGGSGSDAGTDSGSGSGDAGSASGTILSGNEQSLSVRMTGYAKFENNPPGTAEICCGVLRSQAGGDGTFASPITVAVPGSGGQGMEFPAGQRFYAPKIKRYLIVEDSGATKADAPHLDVWVDGEGFSNASAERCMAAITGTATVTKNPKAGLPVTAGPLTGPNGCNI